MDARADDALPGSLPVAAPSERATGAKCLESLGLEVDQVTSLIKDHYTSNIVRTYRAIVDSQLRGAGGDPFTIVEKLRLNRSTRWRWENLGVEPDFETYCLALAAFDVDVGPHMPRGREVVIDAARTTLAFIRATLVGGGETLPSRPDIVLLHFTSLSNHWWLACSTRKRSHFLNAAEAIAMRLKQSKENAPLPTPDVIKGVLEEWHTAWCVFHYCAPYTWLFHVRD